MALADVLPRLTRELNTKPDGTWVRVTLPHGAKLALRREADGRRLLAIGRDEAPTTLDAKRRWDAEVETFRRHLGVAHWQAAEIPARPGAVVSGWRELYEGEIRPGIALCADCGAEIGFDLLYGVQRCMSCVRRVSAEEVVANQRRASA